jgi:mono/diheme cytochrome c family protein
MTCFALQACRVAPAGKLEMTCIQWAKHHLTVGGKKDVNPIHSTTETVEKGKKIFASYCVVCHGRDGQNTGVPFAGSMSPAIPPLSSSMVQSYGDGQLKWIIENGIRPSGMPASKGILSDRDMWTIVVYLRHLPPAGSLGQPRAYSEDEYAK